MSSLRIFALTSLVLLSSSPLKAGVIYVGSWRNLTFSTQGPATFDIDLAPPTYRFVFDLDGGVFGSGDPDPVVLEGPTPPPGNDLQIDGSDPFFGDIAGTLSPLGVVDLELTDTIRPDINSVEVNGTLTPQEIDLTYDIIFQAGAPANGVITAVVPEPPSWLLSGSALAMTLLASAACRLRRSG